MIYDHIWDEYDSAVEYKARYGYIPFDISIKCHDLINEDIEAFDQRVKDMAYAIAMSVHMD